MAVEARRGCGYRQVGGLYLVSEGLGEPCHRLPFPLEVCPTCNQGIKHTRGWTWVGKALFEPGCAENLDKAMRLHCMRCVLCSPDKLPRGHIGLLWVGGKFYPTVADFEAEAAQLGVSRRITAIPKNYQIGDFVALAHAKAIPGRSCHHNDGTTVNEELAGPKIYRPGECPHKCHDNEDNKPGIFRVFAPSRIEIIVRESEATPERIAEEAKRGVTVVAVPDGDPDHDPNGALLK